MRSRDRFIADASPRWKQLDTLIQRAAKRRPTGYEVSQCAALYRSVCTDLMKARALGCEANLISHLETLTARSHNTLYSRTGGRWKGAWDLITAEFPRTLRKNWAFFALASLLFWGPFAFGALATLISPEFAFEVMPPAALENAANYGTDVERSDGGDSLMMGFYVYNNIGIAFRCFATGIFFGLGSIFFLVYNGLSIGTFLGHVFNDGNGANFINFTSGHSAFELTAIVISGAAGLRMGYSLARTNGLTRIGSLRAAGPDLFKMILGAAFMLFIAAMIEAFWSASTILPPVKWGFGIAMWFVVAGYLLFPGRERTADEVAPRRAGARTAKAPSARDDDGTRPSGYEPAPESAAGAAS
jgi:uncharacterized membrane protein SpoIIM required for sporulation